MGIRIISDGTPHGMKAYTASGAEITGISAILIEPMRPGQPVRATLHFNAPRIDVTAGRPSRVTDDDVLRALEAAGAPKSIGDAARERVRNEVKPTQWWCVFCWSEECGAGINQCEDGKRWRYRSSHPPADANAPQPAQAPIT